MRTLEYKIKIEEDGKLTLDLPSDIPPGTYELILVIAGQEITATAHIQNVPKTPPDVEMIDWDIVPENSSFSREELYN